jgi:hypothetical protein
MSVITPSDNADNTPPKPASPAVLPDIPSECRDAALATGKAIAGALNKLGSEQALKHPDAAKLAMAGAASGSIVELAECMQRNGLLPPMKSREGRPMS